MFMMHFTSGKAGTKLHGSTKPHKPHGTITVRYVFRNHPNEENVEELRLEVPHKTTIERFIEILIERYPTVANDVKNSIACVNNDCNVPKNLKENDLVAFDAIILQ
mmetsp:Transcript_13014/g.14419  ORF Transcript_13014/g.14419 Transcript_13014/m.14419 type:complete len:106 (+) Transcript_13014:77-394(+)